MPFSTLTACNQAGKYSLMKKRLRLEIIIRKFGAVKLAGKYSLMKKRLRLGNG